MNLKKGVLSYYYILYYINSIELKLYRYYVPPEVRIRVNNLPAIRVPK